MSPNFLRVGFLHIIIPDILNHHQASKRISLGMYCNFSPFNFNF